MKQKSKHQIYLADTKDKDIKDRDKALFYIGFKNNKY